MAACLPLGACTPRSPLRVSGHPWPGYEPLFLARNLGYTPKGMELVEAATLQESLELVRAQRVHGAMLTLDEVLQLRDEGLPLQIVLVFDISRGADVLLATPDVPTLQGLRGRRIGVEDTALGSLMMALVLERAGLSERDVVLMKIPYERHEAAFLRGELDALISYEPVAGRLLKHGAQLLLSTRDLPDTIFDVLAVNQAALTSHGDEMRAGLAAYFQALSYMRHNPWDAAYRSAQRLQVSAEEMIDSLRGLELPDRVGNQRYLGGGQSPLVSTALRLSPIMQKAGLIRTAVRPRELMTADFLPAT